MRLASDFVMLAMPCRSMHIGECTFCVEDVVAYRTLSSFQDREVYSPNTANELLTFSRVFALLSSLPAK